jgi:hypothetical protein
VRVPDKAEVSRAVRNGDPLYARARE